LVLLFFSLEEENAALTHHQPADFEVASVWGSAIERVCWLIVEQTTTAPQKFFIY
jgi:hypothetical protein